MSVTLDKTTLTQGPFSIVFQSFQLSEFVSAVQGQEHLVEAIIKGTKIQS